MQGAHIHPEGVEILKWFAFAALVVVVFVLRFSNFIPHVYRMLFEKAATAFPESKRKRRKLFKLSYKTKVRQKIAFWTLSIAIIGFLLLQWFVVPEVNRIDRTLLLPLACTTFAAGAIVIGLGPAVDERGAKWRRWPFWATVFATSISVFLIARFLNPQTPKGVLGVLMICLIPFMWILGFMNFVDDQLAERSELGISRDYDGTKPLQTPHGVSSGDQGVCRASRIKAKEIS